MTGLLVVLLALLFFQTLLPKFIAFSNDGPLGAVKPIRSQFFENYLGAWADLNSVGAFAGASCPSITQVFLLGLGVVGYAKFYAPLCLLVLGLGAWTFFRALKLSPLACTLGALAAVFNSTEFSTACWGVAGQPLALGLTFLALAALVDNVSKRRWVKVALAGLAVGICVTEAADIGALYSFYVAAFVMYQAWSAETGSKGVSLASGVVRIVIVALFAGLMAAQTVTMLVATQVTGVQGTQQDARSKQERWDWATQWSFPKREVLSLAVPGLFGYRMDTPEGGNYWGAVGRDAAWDRYFAAGAQGQPPQGFIRYNGGGVYAGVLVVLLALWAGIQSLRGENSLFGLANRKWIWFWLGVALVSLLLAFGRFAPFYQFLYALPYFSTVRNPAKFSHPLGWALVVLFAYGVHGLSRRYLEVAGGGGASLSDQLKNWWSRVTGFDRKWTIGCLLALGASALGWLIYTTSRTSLEGYLQTVQFDPETAKAIAGFSIGQVGVFLLFFALSVGLLAAVMSGYFTGGRAKWGALCMGTLLFVDLARVDQRWLRFWDWQQKYATNPVLDTLREKPYEHRVAILPSWIPDAFKLPQQVAAAEQFLDQIYRLEWAQHHFLYYGIQSLDIVQMPRVPEDLGAFEGALQFRGTQDTLFLIARRWQLTNTRYLMGASYLLPLLNQQFDPGAQRFKIREQFNLVPKPGISRPSRLEEMTAVPVTNGTYAVFEFTGAVPRAKLYTNWQVSTNDQATLTQLGSPGFDPLQTVLVAGGVPAPVAASTNQNAGTVEYVSYNPKRIVLKAQSTAPSVLLLSDKYDPNWQVTVDGEPASLLRCNYLMRGVYLAQPGTHTVGFQLRAKIDALYVSLGAIALGVVLSLVLLVWKDPPPNTTKDADSTNGK